MKTKRKEILLLGSKKVYIMQWFSFLFNLKEKYFFLVKIIFARLADVQIQEINRYLFGVPFSLTVVTKLHETKN